MATSFDGARAPQSSLHRINFALRVYRNVSEVQPADCDSAYRYDRAMPTSEGTIAWSLKPHDAMRGQITDSPR